MARLKPGEFEVEGIVLEALPNLTYRIEVTQGSDELNGKEIRATVSGQMKLYKIRVMPGDGVKVLMTQYDKTKGRITFRMKVTPQMSRPSAETPLTAGPELKLESVETPIIEPVPVKEISDSAKASSD